MGRTFERLPWWRISVRWAGLPKRMRPDLPLFWFLSHRIANALRFYILGFEIVIPRPWLPEVAFSYGVDEGIAMANLANRSVLNAWTLMIERGVYVVPYGDGEPAKGWDLRAASGFNVELEFLCEFRDRMPFRRPEEALLTYARWKKWIVEPAGAGV
ncbi:MAG: hypothetical protein JNK76_25860 [Planctomycetales bacterium]|nr:hypothetical protein [Planctomycetales bacterium]